MVGVGMAIGVRRMYRRDGEGVETTTEVGTEVSREVGSTVGEALRGIGSKVGLICTQDISDNNVAVIAHKQKTPNLPLLIKASFRSIPKTSTKRSYFAASGADQEVEGRAYETCEHCNSNSNFHKRQQAGLRHSHGFRFRLRRL